MYMYLKLGHLMVSPPKWACMIRVRYLFKFIFDSQIAIVGIEAFK